MSWESVGRLQELTGFGREKLNRRLRGLPYQDGPRGSKLFATEDVLPILYGASERAADGVNVDLHAARAALAVKQTEKISFEMETKRGNFVPFDEILAAGQRIFVSFRTRMMSIPTKAAPVLAEIDQPVEIQLVLEEHVADALQEVSDLVTTIEQYTSPALEAVETEPGPTKKAHRK